MPRRAHRIAQRLDETVIAELVQTYRDGIPTTQLTGRYGLAKGSVLKLLRAHDVQMRGPSKRVSEAESDPADRR
ncbi:hypothetical protein ACSMXN_05590 [Jatrophihabitans sp. DSM 45814]